MGRTERSLLAVLAVWTASLSASSPFALETDQYYAWGRDLPDATDVLNAKVNVDIDDVLHQLNGRRSWDSLSCHDVTKKIAERFKWFIFQDIEIWANNTPLVHRIPATADEADYMRRYLYHVTNLFDPGTKVPPSPTIEMDGVRLGTDKLSHFFSQGWWYYKAYRKARRAGLDHAAAEMKAIRSGIFGERTLLGWTWGVFSSADLEANYQGLHFLLDLCQGDSPALEKTDAGWRHVRRFDFRDYVSPEWDESYQTPMYGERRWKRVRPVLAGYCPMRRDPQVAARLEDYVGRDRETVTEREISRMVAAGRLPDAKAFSLDAVCESAALAETAAPTSQPAAD